MTQKFDFELKKVGTIQLNCKERQYCLTLDVEYFE
jgi:hypothetical protein